MNETVQQIAERRRDNTGGEAIAETAAHSLLQLVCDRPGQMGRLRAARVISGFHIAYREDEDAESFSKYAVPALDWPLREVTRLVDAMIEGGLVAQTPGPRPTLVLTRAGFGVAYVLGGRAAPTEGAAVAEPSDQAHTA